MILDLTDKSKRVKVGGLRELPCVSILSLLYLYTHLILCYGMLCADVLNDENIALIHSIIVVKKIPQ